MEILNPGESIIQTSLESQQTSENHPLYEKLSKLSIDDLKDRCKKNSISGFSRLKKAEIINLIVKNFIKKFNDDCSQLTSLKLDELKALCKSNGLSGYSTMKKDELISFISSANIMKSLDKTEEKDINISNSDISNISSPEFNTFITTENILENLLNEKKLLEQKEKLIYEQLEKERLEKERLEKERLEKERLEKERLEKERLEKELSTVSSEIDRNKKKKIPKAVKTHVWNLYIGAHINEHRCLCCKKALIKITEFETGHVVSEAEGGTMEISNLRPICSVCNYSMGTMNMIEYVKKYGYYI